MVVTIPNMAAITTDMEVTIPDMGVTTTDMGATTTDMGATIMVTTIIPVMAAQDTVLVIRGRDTKVHMEVRFRNFQGFILYVITKNLYFMTDKILSKKSPNGDI